MFMGPRIMVLLLLKNLNHDRSGPQFLDIAELRAALLGTRQLYSLWSVANRKEYCTLD